MGRGGSGKNCLQQGHAHMVLSQNRASDGGAEGASRQGHQRCKSPEVEENGACPGRGKQLGLKEGALGRDEVREVSGPL